MSTVLGVKPANRAFRFPNDHSDTHARSSVRQGNWALVYVVPIFIGEQARRGKYLILCSAHRVEGPVGSLEVIRPFKSVHGRSQRLQGSRQLSPVILQKGASIGPANNFVGGHCTGRKELVP